MTVRLDVWPKAALVLLALAWAWAGWFFQARQYAQIFLAAPWLAWACGAQAVLHGRAEGEQRHVVTVAQHDARTHGRGRAGVS